MEILMQMGGVSLLNVNFVTCGLATITKCMIFGITVGEYVRASSPQI